MARPGLLWEDLDDGNLTTLPIAVDAFQRYGSSLATGACMAIIGYVCDSLQWTAFKATVILVGYICASIYTAAPGRAGFHLMLTHLATTALSLLVNQYYPSISLEKPVSMSFLALFCGEVTALVVTRFVLLDGPLEDGAVSWRQKQFQFLSHIVTAATLFHGQRNEHLVFVNLWDWDPISGLAFLIVSIFLVVEFGKRAVYGETGYSLETAYDAFCQTQQNCRKMEYFVTEIQAEVLFLLKLVIQFFPEYYHRRMIDFDNLPFFDHNDIPLQPHEIRLLRLKRRSVFSPGLLDAELMAVSIDDARTWRYEALSYTWGDPEAHLPLMVNGRCYAINANLYDLLYARRSLFYQRLIWVDAICIDQSNNAEKSQQVLKMRDIYAKAHRVIAWLGDTADSALAAKLISDLHARRAAWTGTGSQFFFSWDRKSPAWRAFVGIFTLPYFSRAWIFQELAVGHNVQFYLGGRYLRLDVLYRAMESVIGANVRATFCMENDFFSGHDFDGFVNLRTAHFFRPQNPEEHCDPDDDYVPLSLLLSATAPLKATEAVDKIYALLGISNSAVARSIQPDYESSIAQVFFDTAVRLLRSNQEAEFVFPHAGIGSPRKTQGLPSWVPDWDAEGERHSMILSHNPPPGIAKLPKGRHGLTLQEEVYALDRYEAGGNPKPLFFINRNAKILATKAIQVDTITVPFIVELDTRRRDPEYYQTWLRMVDQFVRGAKMSVATGMPRAMDDPAALPRTLTADRKHGCSSASELLDAYRMLKDSDFFGVLVESRSLSLLRGTLGAHTASPSERAAEAARHVRAQGFAERVNQCCMGRKVAVTDGGRLALVPSFTDCGDAVFVIPGLQMPYVLRRSCKPGAEDAWELVGECYLDGVMNGEMMDEEALERIVMR